MHEQVDKRSPDTQKTVQKFDSQNRVRTGIVGATGYTALELIYLLLRHPAASIELVTSRTDSGQSIAQVHPSLHGRLDLPVTQLNISQVDQFLDCAFCCLPHGASAEIVSELLANGIKVVDFSADYRLNDVATYQKWYQGEHPDPARVGQTAYGLPELYKDLIRDSQLVANPGCFPTSAILPLAPLVKDDLIDPSSIIVDSKTGISGGGRQPKLVFHYPECNESVAAYGVGQHRHQPEIDQILTRFTGKDVSTTFTPHLVPMDRGILSTIYVRPRKDWTTEQWLGHLRDFYSDAPFVRVVDHLPATKHVQHTNYCDITARQVGCQLILISVIDNLVKGASGAAVQNFNLMFGFDETLALV